MAIDYAFNDSKVVETPSSYPYHPRRPLVDSEPDGYMESDKDYVANNLDLAVKLLDSYAILFELGKKS